jgi:hypothetical protein
MTEEREPAKGNVKAVAFEEYRKGSRNDHSIAQMAQNPPKKEGTDNTKP